MAASYARPDLLGRNLSTHLIITGSEMQPGETCFVRRGGHILEYVTGCKRLAKRYLEMLSTVSGISLTGYSSFRWKNAHPVSHKLEYSKLKRQKNSSSVSSKKGVIPH